MKRHTVIAVLVIAGLVGALVSPAWAMQDQREQEVSKQFYPLSPNGQFSLRNINGAVQIRAWEQGGVQVTSTKRGPSKEKMDLVSIEVSADQQRVAIETIYPRAERNLNVSVDYEVLLPQGARVDRVETVNGSVEIDGIIGEVRTQTVNGSLKVLNAGGRVSAGTVNGNIQVELQQVDATADLKFETVNGSIKLYLPGQAGADVSAETVNGSLSSDFGLSVQGKWGPRKMSGVIGSGGARVRAETVNGSINVFRR